MESRPTKRPIPKGSMVYNEWGELVDPHEDTASKELDVRGMFRLINLNWHYIVSSDDFLRILALQDGFPLSMLFLIEVLLSLLFGGFPLLADLAIYRRVFRFDPTLHRRSQKLMS